MEQHKDRNNPSSLWQDGSDVVICFTVRPGAKKNGVIREHDNSLRVDIHAPPEKGKANEELLRFVASIFQRPLATVTLRHGHTSRRKIVAISDLKLPEALVIVSSLLTE